MAVVVLDEIADGRSMGLTVEDKEVVRIYERTFKAITSSALDDGPVIRLAMAAIGIVLGARYVTDASSDTGATVKSIDPKQDSTPLEWTVSVKYSSKAEQPEQESGETTENPLARRAKVSYAAKLVPKLLEKDIDGAAVTNSAGDAFEEALEGDDGRLVITITKNLQDADQLQMKSFIGALNSQEWFTWPPRWAKMMEWTASPQESNGLEYYEHIWVIEISDNWDEERLDQGYHVYGDEGGAERKQILDAQGQPVSKPVLLDGFGHVLEGDDWEPVFLTFRKFHQQNFGVLNIPN